MSKIIKQIEKIIDNYYFKQKIFKNIYQE